MFINRSYPSIKFANESNKRPREKNFARVSILEPSGATIRGRKNNY